MNERFSAAIKQDESLNETLVLEDKKTGNKIEVFAFGALLNAFNIINKAGQNINIIDGFSSIGDAKQNITNGFKSAKLSPFVCRLKNGEYEYENQFYKVHKFYLQTEAIHGIIYDKEFTIVNVSSGEESASVSLNYNYQKDDAGFPFEYDVTVEYELKPGNALSLSTTIKTGNNSMPLSDGWHPYFTLQGLVDDMTLWINTERMMEFNQQLLPTGNFNEYNKFNQPGKIENTQLDNCFVLKNTNEPACVLRNEAEGLQLSIQPDNSYPYLQVYIPLHRKSIALENLSSPPDAFNNYIHLIHAKPFSKHRFVTTYRADVF